MSEWRWFMRIYSCDGKAANLQEVTFISNWKNRLESWIFTWLTGSIWHILVFFICFEYILYLLQHITDSFCGPFFNLLDQSPVIYIYKSIIQKFLTFQRSFLSIYVGLINLSYVDKEVILKSVLVIFVHLFVFSSVYWKSVDFSVQLIFW